MSDPTAPPTARPESSPAENPPAAALRRRVCDYQASSRTRWQERRQQPPTARCSPAFLKYPASIRSHRPLASKPPLSVVVPALNDRETLARALTFYGID